MIMQGLTPPIIHNDPEHEAKIELYTQLLESETAALEVKYGKVAPNAMQVLKEVIVKHQRYFEMLQQPSNVENPFGGNQSPTLGLQAGQSVPQPQPQPQAQQQPMPEEQQPEGEMNV